ncbi:MAG: HAMP domain-containing histidine kinase [Anaerohalosphaera sp.]|nr:HAMP domain-containing histidine kinase [Anaerohalosphaera sp.]
MAIFFASKVVGLALQCEVLYGIAGFLGIYNLLVYILLRYFGRSDDDEGDQFPIRSIKAIVNLQISVDLLTLTILMHFSGGIKNPFIVFFVFHMILSSILLSPKESYLQATFASVLIGLMAYLEQTTLHHYCLEGSIRLVSVSNDLTIFGITCENMYIMGVVAVMSCTFNLVVFITCSISTQLRKQEQGYWLANIELEQKDRIKDEYVSRVTHDIKGHLAAIQSSLDVVSKGMLGPLNERQSEFIGRAGERTRTLATFVRALLRLTRLRLSDSVDKQQFCLDETIRNCVEAARLKASDKTIELTSVVELSDSKVFGEQLSIEEMITNLVLNSVKYTPAGGKVEVVAKRDGDHVVITISDTGIGIPKKELPRVFDEFFRASNARATERDGTGLGLSLARQIVKRHEGKISVESEIGRGTTFTIELPLID